MKYPNSSEERKLRESGHKFVVGLDEAGRGPLAGPVVAAAVVLRNFQFTILKKINDSKKLTPKAREEIYKILVEHPDVEWGVGIVSEKVIDKINILEATKLAMSKAVNSLVIKNDDRQKRCKVDYLLLDGNFKIKAAIPQKPIIRGDQKVISIAAASIIAKVTRDKIMRDYHKKYPEYGFEKHKGYPTEFHRLKIKELGLCAIHRKTFCS